MFGFGQDETLDYTTFRSLVLAEELARFDHTVAETIDGQQRFRDRHTVRVMRVAGEVVRDHSGAIVSVLGTGTDITEQQTVSNELAHLAAHDPLTGRTTAAASWR